MDGWTWNPVKWPSDWEETEGRKLLGSGQEDYFQYPPSEANVFKAERHTKAQHNLAGERDVSGRWHIGKMAATRVADGP